MQKHHVSTMARTGMLALACGAAVLTGCGVNTTRSAETALPVSASAVKMQGRVHGGQQPVSGSTLQLWVASSSGYGTASYPMQQAQVQTDSTGSFSITGDYACPSASSQVYLTATGGDPGTGHSNPQLALMTALGSCSLLSSTTYININELTTVAAVWSLAPFLSSYSAIGSPTTNMTGLQNAFLTPGRLVNFTTGNIASTANITVPTAELNTLGNILATCVNTTGGVAGDGSPCGKLFSATKPASGAAATDTIGAALLMAKNPSQNAGTLVKLPVAQAPFQPSLASATDFTISIKYAPSGISNPAAAAVDAVGGLWIANAGNGTVTQLDATGTVVNTFSNMGQPSGIAFDGTGTIAYVTDQTRNTVETIKAGVSTGQAALSKLKSPSSIAIDAQGQVWITNSGDNSVYVAKPVTNGTGIPTNGTRYTGAGMSAPAAVAINPN